MGKVKTINFTHLESYNVIKILKTYCDLLKSHQDGRYKLLVNSCNNKLLAYHQSVTLYHVGFGHPICQFISYFIKEMPFCGLYCGIITSSYLRKVLELIQDQQHLLAHKEIVSRLDSLKNIVLSILEELKEEVYLESHRLVSMVKSCLKPWLVDYSFSELLAVSLVKATLLATDETSHRLGHIIIKAVDGRNSCEVYNGVIYKLESLWVPKVENFTAHGVHILLFTEPLEISDFKNATITENEFVDLIVSARIKVIACQKPIHKKVIFLLRRHQIFALERLGEETANALAHLSAAFPISDLRQVKWNELHNFIGVISSLRSVTLLNENYLLMENVGRAVVTLFINHRNFDTLDQLKAILKECIHTVYTIFKAPYLLPEDFESCLTKQLRNYEDTDVILRRMMSLFAETIYESTPYMAQSQTNIKPNSNNVYLLKRNSLAQAFLLTANILEVGLFVNTK